jgi:hypothetical protein
VFESLPTASATTLTTGTPTAWLVGARNTDALVTHLVTLFVVYASP